MRLTIRSVAELCELVEQEFRNDKGTTVVYRGHGAKSFDLRPKVGRLRPAGNSSGRRVNEKLMLQLFRRQTFGLSAAVENEWELLAIAQHHGMATRLLDWSRSPLVGLYFAVCRECESREKDGRPLKEDAELIAWRSNREVLNSEYLSKSPFKVKKVSRYIPRVVTPRLRAQSGLFSIQPDPSHAMSEVGMARISIPFDRRKAIKDALYRLGINESVLFPDLDGVARHIEWLQTKSY